MAVHIVSETEIISGAVTYSDGIMVPMGTTLRLVNGAFLTTRDIHVMGALEIGTSSVNIPNTGSVKIKLEGNTPPKVTSSDPSEGNIMIMMGGSFKAYGTPERNKLSYTRLTSTAEPGDNTINVESVLGWLVGDKMGISCSSMYPWETEERTIMSISGNGPYTITLDNPLNFYHYGSTDSSYTYSIDTKTKSQDVRAEVSNLSRSIEIYTEDSDIYGAHIMVMDNPGLVQLTGVQMSRLGMTAPSEHNYREGGSIVRRDESPSGKGLPGKYNLHWHKCGDFATDHYASNCVTYKSRHKSFVVHASNGVSLSYNVAFRGWSHQFSIGEDGNEKNILAKKNLVQYGRRLYNGDGVASGDNDWAFPTNKNLKENRVSGGSWQNELHPGAFWITTPSCTIVDNIVAGMIAGTGYYFDFCGSRGDASGFLELDPDIEYGNLIFTGNTAHSIVTEGGHKFGTTADVTQGINTTDSGIGFSYRSAGWAIFFDQFDPDRPARVKGTFQYLMEDFHCYSCTGLIWMESPACRLKNFSGFHIGTAGMTLGGFLEDGIVIKKDLLGDDEGILADQRNPALHPDFGNLSNSLTHYEGYYLFTGSEPGIVKVNMNNIINSAFNVWTKDNANGTIKIFKRMQSFKGVYVDGYTNYIRVTHANEGPMYIADWKIINKNTSIGGSYDHSDILVNLKKDGTTSGGPGEQTQSIDGVKKYDSDNIFNAGAFDLDNNLLYIGDGTTRVASDWVVARIVSLDGSELEILANKADDAATWYDTNHAFKFASGAKTHVHEFFDTSCTAILRKDTTLTYSTTSPIEINVYGTEENVGATIGSTRYEYSPNLYRDGFNINYLTDNNNSPGSNTGTRAMDSVIYSDRFRTKVDGAIIIKDLFT